MIKILVCGICGKMGRTVCELVSSDGDAEIICGVDPFGAENGFKVYKDFSSVTEKPDVIIDFSSPAALDAELAYCEKCGVPAVLASTGYSAEQLEKIKSASKKTAIFKTANFSLGVNLLCELTKKAAEVLGEEFDIEIVEKHHNQKKDAPSGTALMLAESANSAFGNAKPYVNGRDGIVGKRGNEIGLHAVRGGTIVGEHDVLFCGEDEIVTLSHSARSKRIFAAGALKAAKWVADKQAGMYDMKDLLKDIL